MFGLRKVGGANHAPSHMYVPGIGTGYLVFQCSRVWEYNIGTISIVEVIMCLYQMDLHTICFKHLF